MPDRSFCERRRPLAVFLACCLLPSISMAAAQEPLAADAISMPQRVISFEHINQELVLKCDVGRLIIKPYADNIVHVRYLATLGKTVQPLWGISATPSASRYRVDSTLAAIKLSTPRITVSVDRKTAQITFLDQKQNVLLTSRAYQLKSLKVAGEDTFNVHAEFVSPDDEAYYGLGQQPAGWMDLRGKTIPLWHDFQRPEGDVVAIPFLITNRKYGMVFDNPARTTVIPGKDGVTSWDAEAGNVLSYFVIGGGATDDIYRGYRFLTGTVPMPPKSALGYILSAQKPASQDQVMDAVRKYREKNSPADFLAINMGQTGIDPKQWPDPAGMNAGLGRLGIKVMISSWLRMQKGFSHFDTLDSMGCIVKDKDGKLSQDARGALIDITKPSCASWFWNHIQEDFASRGFAGWWLDGYEPALVPLAGSLHAGIGARVFNLYPLFPAKAVWEGQRRDLKERVFIFSRSGYLGAQQYGAAIASNSALPQWETLKRQIPAGLNMAASGMPYWSTAIGAGTPTGSAGPGKAPDDASELFLRWFQFSAFCPIFRAHDAFLDNPSWNPGPAAETIVAKYLGLRYRLLPYIYSLAHSVTETGAPFMRSLFMDFPQDPAVRDIGDEYMFGPALLVAPVVEKGKTSREVYLPKGSAWYEYWTGRKHPGGQQVLADAPLDLLPLFVRAGSIIPHGNEISDTRAEQREVEIRVYAGADAGFDLYQDDGVTYEYEKGKFSLAQLRWTEATQRLTITGDDRKLFARPQERWLTIIK